MLIFKKCTWSFENDNLVLEVILNKKLQPILIYKKWGVGFDHWKVDPIIKKPHILFKIINFNQKRVIELEKFSISKVPRSQRENPLNQKSPQSSFYTQNPPIYTQYQDFSLFRPLTKKSLKSSLSYRYNRSLYSLSKIRLSNLSKSPKRLPHNC